MFLASLYPKVNLVFDYCLSRAVYCDATGWVLYFLFPLVFPKLTQFFIYSSQINCQELKIWAICVVLPWQGVAKIYCGIYKWEDSVRVQYY